jgi:hypothetical protein
MARKRLRAFSLLRAHGTAPATRRWQRVKKPSLLRTTLHGNVVNLHGG